MNDEDLLTTNLFESSSNMQSNYEKFRKKRSKSRLRNVPINPNKFNVLESEMKKDSLMLKQKQKVDNRNVKKKLKKTIVTIDSRDRNQLPKIITEGFRKLANNSIYFKNGTKKILIHLPNHGFNLEKGSIQIIIKGVKGDVVTKEGETIIDDNICGVPLSHIHYNDGRGSFHTISEVSSQYDPSNYDMALVTKDTVLSDYFFINLDTNIEPSAILNGNGGGNGITIEKIVEIETGYDNPNHYKIQLGKKFNNIVQVRLISTNTEYHFTFENYIKADFLKKYR